MALKVTVQPTVEPVSLTEAKSHCRVDIDDDDILIQSYIKAARIYAEGLQNRAFVTRTYELWLDGFPYGHYPYGRGIEIPMPPLVSVTSIDIYATDNTKTTDTTLTNYFIDTKSEPGRILLAYSCLWPTTVLRPANGVCITFVAGYGVAEVVPENVKAAIKLIVGHLYEHRESIIEGRGFTPAELPMGVEALLGIERVWPV